MKRTNLTKCLFFTILFIPLIILVILQYDCNILVNLLSFLCFILCLLNCYKYRKNIPVFLLHLQLLYYIYSVVFSRYLNEIYEYTEFYSNTNNIILGIGIVCLYIFEYFMFFFFRATKDNKSRKYFSNMGNEFLVIILLFILIIIGVFGFDRTLYGERGATTAVYEYSGILFIFAFHYIGINGKKIYHILLSIILFLFIFQGFIYGERIAGLQFMIIWTCFYLCKKLNYKSILIASFIGIILMTILGAYRQSYSFSNEFIKNIIKKLSERMLTFDGADLGFYCSLTFIMVANSVPWKIRIELFEEFIKAIIIGSSEKSYLPEFTRKYYAHWYGGFYPHYFYFYMGIFGVIISTILVIKILNWVENGKSVILGDSYFELLEIYIIAITARWFMYTPLSLFRGILFFTIIYIILVEIDKIMIRRFGVINRRL